MAANSVIFIIISDVSAHLQLKGNLNIGAIGT